MTIFQSNLTPHSENLSIIHRCVVLQLRNEYNECLIKYE